jgi:hypothetical protein
MSTYHLAHGGYYGGGGGLYVGQDSLYPCTAGGAERPLPATASALVRRIGARIAGLTTWMDDGVVHAEPS